MKNHLYALFLTMILASSTAAYAQDYIPSAQLKSPQQKLDALKYLRQLSAVKSLQEDSPSSDPFSCATPPPISSLVTSVTSTTMSSSMALSLGLPVGSVGVSGNTKVFVQDWTRSKPCLAMDGKTQLIYGQGIRIIATVMDLDAKADLTLAMIAAQATLSGKSSSIQAIVIGIPDQAVQLEATSLLGQLDVTNFAEKSRIAQSLAAKAVVATTGTSEFIGVRQSTPDLTGQVATVFALQQMSERKTCLDAKSKFPSTNTAHISAIESTYVSITKVCDASQPGEVHKAIAKDALLGLKIKM